MAVEQHPGTDPVEAHSARVWNYWLGGEHHFPVDRAAGDAVAQVYPQVVNLARESRRFLGRVVRFLVGEAGVRQFLDIGCGLPISPNTHQIAQAAVAEAKVVYVDNDPLVFARFRALVADTTEAGITTYLDADYRRPDLIAADARNVLNLNEPVAALFMGCLGHAEDLAQVRAVVTGMLDALAPGSYLALWDGTDTGEAARSGARAYPGAVPYRLRGIEQLHECLEGLELVEPGLVPIGRWREGNGGEGSAGEPEPLDAYGALVHKR